jgi:hypothetical protein
MDSGASGSQVIREMEKLGERFNHTNLNTHKPHVQSPETQEETERLIRALESEAAVASPVVETLYRELIRSVRTMPTRKPASAQEAVRLVQSIKELTGAGPKQELMMAYARRAFAPGGALHPDTPTIANGRLRYYRDDAGRLVEILDGRYQRTLEESEM